MKIIKYFLGIVLFVAAVISCTKDEFGSVDFVSTVTTPANLAVLFDVTPDNTGLVTITPNSEGAVSYSITFGDETTDPVTVEQGESTNHVYAEGNYEVKMIATGITGLKTEETNQLLVSFEAPENLEVVIENDPAISKQVNVTANADYAISFDVYYGEEGNDEPVTANIGETASYVYKEAGTYTIRVVAKSAAIETTEETQEFEVTAILQPLVAAVTPPNRADIDVVSMFSEKYPQTTVDMWVTDWSVVTLQEEVAIEENQTLVYRELAYAGIITETSPMDASAMEYFHVDVWSTDVETFKIKFVDFNGTGYNDGTDNIEFEVANTIPEEGKWVSFDIPLSDFEGVPFSDINQTVIAADPVGTVFLDNMYFWREESVVVQPLVYDDFEGNGNITTWFGDDCGMNTAFANPFKTGINTSNTVLEYNDTGGTYANVRFDTASNFDLTVDNTFTLKIYVPSNGITGSQPNQISLKLQDGTAGEPWAQQTEIIKTVVLDMWQEITFDFANDATSGAADPISRTDFNRVVLQVNGENNGDAVVAYIDDFSYGVATGTPLPPPFDDGLLTNGDFENGAAPWTIGVGTDPVPVVTDAGNSYYSVDVTTAGNAYDVNASQKLEIIEGKTYTLSFDAWSDTERPILPGIGLSADPWTNITEEVNITTTKQTYTVTLIANAGASDARVFFDLGAAVGSVNIDNVSLFVDGGGTTPPPSSGAQIDLPVDFEGTTVDYTLTDFGENSSSLVEDPTNASNTVAKVIKTSAAATWAGTTIGTDLGFATNIPITLTNSKMTVRVWSPTAGTPIRLKIEDANDNSHTCETETNTTVAAGWETLEFDFVNQATGTESLSVGLSNGWVYNKASIFFNFGTDGATAGEQTYYFDDVLFVQ